MRTFFTLTALAIAFVGFGCLTYNAPHIAGAIAVFIAVFLRVLYVRGPEPLFAWITGEHPDAKGSLDTHPENTP